MDASVGASGGQCFLDHAVPVEQRDARERSRTYEHLEMVHGAGHVANLHHGIGHRLAQQPGYRFIDHERPVYDPRAAGTRPPWR